MLGVQVDLLTGRYAATRFNDRTLPEWPPHPGRLFSALVAAWADTDDPDPDERAALLWLESLDPPQIVASGHADRSPVTFFVPNNEASAVVVADQGRSYAKLAEIGDDLTEVHRHLAEDPSDRDAQKVAAKLEKAREKLLAKVRTDSAKASARKRTESADVVAGGIQLLPDERGKQGRAFPVAIPHDPVVVFQWPDVEPTPAQRAALDRILARIARLGHSSSMVSCTLVDEELPPAWVPVSDGPVALRIPTDGLLDALEMAYVSHRGSEPRVLPNKLAAYGAPRRSAPSDPVPFLDDSWIVLADTSPNLLPITRSLDVAVAVRGAIMRFADDPIPELLSGHQVGGGSDTPPSEQAHLAVFALPFVGHRHADGLIRGVGLALPRSAPQDVRDALGLAVRRWIADSGSERARLMLGRAGVRLLDASEQVEPIQSLRSSTWCRASRRWGTVTPIALDRRVAGLWDPRPERHEPAEARAIDLIGTACEHVGLPRPSAVTILPSAPVQGSVPLARFPAYRSPGRGVRRVTTHAVLEFGSPVAGPMAIGAGRYFGYGLHLPLRDEPPRSGDPGSEPRSELEVVR